MEKLQGIKPNIRFPEFTDNWEHKKLSELLAEAKKRNEDLKYDKDEVLSVSGELGIVNQIEHLGRSYAGVSVHNYHVVEVGDIVYTKSPLKANPYGIIKLNKHKAGIVSTLYAVYKVKEQNACGEWIEYYFSLDANTNRYLRPLVKKGAKNDMKISNAYVLHDRIFVPSITEQKRIASFFSVLDKKIAQLKIKKQLLEQYKKGVMQQLFSQELRFKPARPSGGDENGNDFPVWEVKKLGEVCDIKKGEQLNKEELTETGSYPCLNGGINFSGYTEKYNSEENTITISEGGNSCGYVNFMTSKFWLGGHCYKVILTNKINTNYFFQLLKFNEKKIMDLRVGSGLPNIQQKDLRSFEISISNSIEEQTAIANFLSALDEKINHTEIQIQQTQVWKKGLLQKMFV